MTVLVTGGAGFIGSHLVDALVADGFSVRVVDNFSTGLAANLQHHSGHIDLVQADLNDDDVANKACRQVDCIFHFAATASVPLSVKDPQRTQQNGEVSTLKLLEAAVKNKARRLIIASSCSVYGDCAALPVSEERLLSPMTPYAASKLACEAYIRAFATSYGLETLALRYFNVFGPRQDPASPYAGVISIFAKRMLEGLSPTIFGDGEQTRDFVSIADVTRANILALRSPRQFRGDAINIGTGKGLSLKSLVNTLNEILGTRIDIEFGPARAGDILHSRADIRLAKKVLSYSPEANFSESLKTFVFAERNRLSTESSHV